MKRIQYFTVLLLTLLSAQILTAQTIINSLISGEHIEPYSNKWKMYAADSEGKESLLTIWTDYAQLIELEGKTYISRVQELYNPDMSLRELWTNLFEHKTLHPYRATQFKTSGDHIYTEFHSDHVKLSLKTATEDLKQKQFDLASPYWDWSMYGILLSGLPFEKGETYTIPVFSQQSPTGQGNILATIEGEEVIKDDNQKTHTTWKVATNTGLTFWLTKEAPYVIQLTSPAQNGGQTIWRMFK